MKSNIGPPDEQPALLATELSLLPWASLLKQARVRSSSPQYCDQKREPPPPAFYVDSGDQTQVFMAYKTQGSTNWAIAPVLDPFFFTKQNHFIFKTSASSKFHLLILTLWSLCDATWPWFPSLTPDTDLPELLQPPLSLSSGIPLSTFSLLPLGSFFPHLHIQIHPHSESRPAPISVPPVRSSLMTSVQINLYLVSKVWS